MIRPILGVAVGGTSSSPVARIPTRGIRVTSISRRPAEQHAAMSCGRNVRGGETMTLPAGMSSSAGATSFCASTGLRIRIFSPRRSTDSHRTRVSAPFGTTAPVAIAVHSPGPIVPVKGFPGNDSPTTVSATSSRSASVLASSKRIAKPSIAARRNPGTDAIAIAGCARRRPAAVSVEILSCGRQDSRSSISDNASATVQPSSGPVGDPGARFMC